MLSFPQFAMKFETNWFLQFVFSRPFWKYKFFGNFWEFATKSFFGQKKNWCIVHVFCENSWKLNFTNIGIKWKLLKSRLQKYHLFLLEPNIKPFTSLQISKIHYLLNQKIFKIYSSIAFLWYHYWQDLIFKNFCKN